MTDDLESRNEPERAVPDADLAPIDFAPLRPSANRASFERTVSSLAQEMMAARASTGSRVIAGIVAWQSRVAVAAAAAVILAVPALVRSPRTDKIRATSVSALALAEEAGVPPEIAAWAREHYRPSASDLVAAFRDRLRDPLYH